MGLDRTPLGLHLAAPYRMVHPQQNSEVVSEPYDFAGRDSTRD